MLLYTTPRVLIATNKSGFRSYVVVVSVHISRVRVFGMSLS